MPNKCQSCWNYGKSIMYCIFKCEGMEKMVKKDGCAICGEGRFKEIGEFELSIQNFNNSGNLIVEYNTYDIIIYKRESFEIKFCPWCGLKL